MSVADIYDPNSLPPHNTHFAANENVIAWKPAEERAEDIEKALEALNDAFPGAGTSTDDQTGAVRRPTQTSESTGVDS